MGQSPDHSEKSLQFMWSFKISSGWDIQSFTTMNEWQSTSWCLLWEGKDHMRGGKFKWTLLYLKDLFGSMTGQEDLIGIPTK